MLVPLAASTTGVVLLGAIYFILLVTLGIISIRKGHWVMFIIGTEAMRRCRTIGGRRA
jgi:hypothetical protein